MRFTERARGTVWNSSLFLPEKRIRMKLLKILCTLLGAAAMSGGCIGEDMSGCPPEMNIRLTFSYRGDTDDPTMFRKMIDRVSLYVFDRESGRHILTKTIEKNDLQRFEGTRLYLPEGSYRIVSWANAGDDTEILVSGTLAECRVHAPAYTSQEHIATNDHLYYGELDLTVPAAVVRRRVNSAAETTGDIPHRSAHINVEVYTKNFGYKDRPATWPVVEMSGLMPQYDMEMNAVQPFDAVYYPKVVWDSERDVAAARFAVLRFPDENGISVSIGEPAPGVPAKVAVNLERYMADNNISVDDKNEVTLRLLFEFTDLGAAVMVPDWKENEVEPDI